MYYGMLGSSRGWRNEHMAISENFPQNVTAEQHFQHRPQNQVTATCSRPVSSHNSLQGCMTDWWNLDDMPAPVYLRKVGIIRRKQSQHGVCSEHAVGQPQRTGVLDWCHVRNYYALYLVSRPVHCVVECFPPYLLKPGDTCRFYRMYMQVCRRHVQVLQETCAGFVIPRTPSTVLGSW